MLVKLNLEGELAEALLRDAEENCRTRPQQVIYILKKHYLSTDKYQNGTNKVLTSTNTEHQGTNEVLDSTDKDNNSTENDQILENLGIDIIEF